MSLEAPATRSARVTPAGPTEWAAAWSLVPAAVLGLLTLPFLYRDCVGDPDTLLMINGVLERPARADMWTPSHKYGLLFSWGYYWILYHLPAEVREQPSRLIAAVNVLGWMGAVLACAALGLLAQRLHGTGRSLALTIPLAFSPMVLELATYGHPLMLSAALLFCSGLALVDSESRRGIPSLAGRLLAVLLLFAALSVRAEVLIALPWLGLVARHERGTRLLRQVLERGTMFALALGAMLLVQHGIAGERVQVMASLGASLSSFYQPGRLLRGVVVFALGSGVALLATVLVLSIGARRALVRAAMPSLLLLGTALLFWLPIPAPARHFFLALVGLCETFALSAVHRLGIRRAIVLAVMVVALNQIAAELLYRPLASTYWPDVRSSRRLATGSVTLGASLPYHNAMRAAHAELREEGRRLAGTVEPEVVFFGDAIDYMILALLERGAPRTWADSLEAGFWAARIDRPGQTFHIVRKDAYRPRDVIAEYLAADPFPRAKVYVQPSTRSRFDRASVPPHRVLTLP